MTLASALFWIGAAQLCVLIASFLVPFQLNWRRQLAALPPIVRQLFWIYGGYIVLSIIALGTICLACADELAQGARLARAFCGYGLAFWGIRVSLQPFLAAKPFLTTWWLHAGYHLLTLLFAAFSTVFAWGVFH